MAQKTYKKIITVAFVALALSVSALVANKTNAVFKGPNPVTNGRLVWSTDSGHTIRSANPDGTGVVNMYNDDTATIMGDPVWSPDQTKIAFVIAKDNETHIYTINGTGANQTPVALTSGSGESGGTDPSWSPDGTKLLFSRQVGSASNIFVMDADGSNQTQLTSGYTTAGRQAFDPQWSPIAGSKQVVFTVADTITTPSMNSNIHTATMNAGETAFVAASDIELEGASWNQSDLDAQGNTKIRGEYDAQFSPEGDKVIFVRRTTGGSYTIGTVLADGSSTVFTTVIDNTKTGGSVFDPAYSPDGKFITFEPKNNLLSIGAVKMFNVEAGTVAQYSGAGAEVDWTYASSEDPTPEDLPDISITCTTEVGKSCTMEIPAYCTNSLSTAPLHGTSVVTQNNDVTQPGSITYTPAANPDGSYNEADENYVHLRDNNVSTANCNVKIVFTKTSVPSIPKTGIVGGLIGVGLAAAIAGGVIYAKEHKNNRAKALGSEK